MAGHKGLIDLFEDAVNNGISNDDLRELLKANPLSRGAGVSLASRLLRTGNVESAYTFSSSGYPLVCDGHDGEPLIAESLKRGTELYMRFLPTLSNRLSLNHLVLLMREKGFNGQSLSIITAYIDHCGGQLKSYEFDYLIKFARGCRSPEVWALIRSRLSGTAAFFEAADLQIKRLGL